jgi:hypothetical protein
MTSSRPGSTDVSDGRVDRSGEGVPDILVLRATRLQERRSRRAAAALGAVFLLVAGWLGARHEAEVAHVRDQQGDLVHAQKLADDHQVGPASHLHGREAHAHDAGVCELLAIAHAPAVASRAPACAVPAMAHDLATPPVAAVHGAIAGYRLAPKTSPPALS